MLIPHAESRRPLSIRPAAGFSRFARAVARAVRRAAIKGTLLLAPEGINGTVAGTDEAIDALIGELRDGALFGGRLDNLELKFSTAPAMPFKRLKVRLKKEIVTLGDGATDPTESGRHLCRCADWNALIADAESLVIDTRNAFEVEMGTFAGAVDPKLSRFGEFPRLCRARTRPGEAQQNRDVLHRRHPLREGQRVSARAAASPRSSTSRAAS